MTDESKQTTTDGRPVDEVRAEQQAEGNKLHASYIILTDEERARGFVRPVRQSYRHVGTLGPKDILEDLSPERIEHFKDFGYIKFEPYPKSESAVTGRYWTRAQLDAVGKACGSSTSMSRQLAETYARQPGFYGSTFCATCGKHFPVGADGEFVWSGTDERVGT